MSKTTKYPVGVEVYVFKTSQTGVVLEVDENHAVKVRLHETEAVYWYRRSEVAYLVGDEQ